MDQIKIRNLRSLKDTGFIDIKPLTILVGKNSSGKSTFLRFFPLMKQTLSTKKNEPILWYSKENVDFGSFEESINRNTTEKIIGFDFNFSINGRYRGESDKPIPLTLSVDLNEKSLKRIKITIFNNEINFLEQNNDYSLTINDQIFQHLFSVYRPNVFETFLPRFGLKIQDPETDYEKPLRKVPITEFFRELIYENVLWKSDKREEKEYQSKLRKDIKLFVQELRMGNFELVAKGNKEIIKKVEQELSSHQAMFEESPEFFNESFEYNDDQESSEISLKENEFIEILKRMTDDEYNKINNLLLGVYVGKLIEISNEYLNSYFLHVHYIAPLRASAQRYYRLQGLAVDEIDPQGENIPMAINHLSSRDKMRFKRWTKSNFGFELETKTKGGHVTLNISFNNNENLNLADTGFGFSQILPILILLWRVENNDFNYRMHRMGRYIYTNAHNIVIEQPELHLHPALQARLTDALVKCIHRANESGIPLTIIIETHSETIINRIGQLIYKEQADKEQINILIFGDIESQDPSETCLTSVSYDDEGTIEEWPLGFFYPEV